MRRDYVNPCAYRYIAIQDVFSIKIYVHFTQGISGSHEFKKDTRMLQAKVLTGVCLVLLAPSSWSLSLADNIGLAIGGYGSSNSIELILKDRVCRGASIKPSLSVPPNASPTWVAEYVDQKVYLCGGQARPNRIIYMDAVRLL